ncbi:MAG: hypothetical protein BMS9Abin37_2092 [Acidobacteriota bacterium]|nr:MAG: hypothetical protein BMS9Abin37_2092 [Acidobacteriota bacterium]
MQDADRIVVIPLSTKPGYDNPGVCIRENEHRACFRPHYVRCDRASLTQLGRIEQGIEQGILEPSDLLSQELLDRIHNALVESEHTPLKVKNVLQEQGFWKSV